MRRYRGPNIRARLAAYLSQLGYDVVLDVSNFIIYLSRPADPVSFDRNYVEHEDRLVITNDVRYVRIHATLLDEHAVRVTARCRVREYTTLSANPISRDVCVLFNEVVPVEGVNAATRKALATKFPLNGRLEV